MREDVWCLTIILKGELNRFEWKIEIDYGTEDD